MESHPDLLREGRWGLKFSPHGQRPKRSGNPIQVAKVHHPAGELGKCFNIFGTQELQLEDGA